ncbi:MAG: hypothetical protein ACKVQK_01465, partial [Burkholderiales bacterium]
MMSALSQILANAPREERGSDAPFWLHTAEEFCWVESGGVDVFAVKREGKTVQGARRHVYRAGAGSILPGIDPAAFGEDQGFLAVCGPGTVLR